MSDFKDNDFDSFEDESFDDFNSNASLKDAWQNNPLLKLFTIIGVIILIVAGLFIFVGPSSTEQESRVRAGIDQNETLGGEVSQQYAQAIEEVNEQRYQQALRTGESAIPMLVNPQERELLVQTDETIPFEEFDPLASFRASAQMTEPEPEVQLVEPEQIFNPQQIQQPAVPAPSPQAVQSLAQAMSQSANDIIGHHQPGVPRIMQVTSNDYMNNSTVGQQIQGQAVQMVDTNGDGIPDTPIDSAVPGDVVVQPNGEVVVQTIIIPAGTINYAQLLIEANSDVPGPILAELASGPLAGARIIGQFTVQRKLLTLSFNTIVLDGISQPINAIAIDPGTTLPGVATEVDNRYFSRIILPAAASFIAGVGAAIADNAGETTVTVDGDTVIEERSGDIDWEEISGQGIEEGFDELSDFFDEEADDVQRLVRVERGTPLGIFFLDPVIESEN